MSTFVALSLGSNVGDRQLFLRRAIASLQALVRPLRCSAIWETAPRDAPAGSGPFLNIAVVGTTRLPALELLETCEAIEARLGRRRSVRNAPRTIDIDLILYGTAVIRGERLVIPHPRFAERNFVLAPLGEIIGTKVDPVSGRMIAEMRGAGDVERIGTLY